MENRLEALLEVLTEKGIALAKARDHVAQLADQHSLLKEMAIIRVMKRDRISSNAAKDIVRSDVEFMQHCVDQRNAGVAVIRADTEYEVAKFRARNASLITPDVEELIEANHSLLRARNEAQGRVLELEEHIGEATDAITALNTEVAQLGLQNSQLVDGAADLTENLKVARRQVDLERIALRKANGYLRDRINDVDRLSDALLKLTAINRELAELRNVPPFEIPKGKDLVDTLQDSRESLTTQGA